MPQNMDLSVKTIDEFIAKYPAEIQDILQKMREAIHSAVPKLGEKISYGIPTFTLNGKNKVHFAAYKSHIGFYPGATGIAMFKDKLGDYEISKGTVRFPIDKPIPYNLIKDITKAVTKQ